MRITTAVALIVLGALFIAFGYGVRWVKHATSEAELRKLLIDGARDAIGAELTVEAVSIGADTVLRVQGVELTLPGQDRPILSASGIEVALDLPAILSGQVGLARATLVSPKIDLLYDADSGEWNFQAVQTTKGEGGPPKGGLLSEGLFLEDATVRVAYRTLFGDDKVRTLPGLHVAVRPRPGDTERWDFQGRMAAGPLRGTTFSGWFCPAGEPDFDISISHPHLRIDKTVWESIPYGDEVWKLFQPEGAFSMTGRIAPREGGDVSIAFHVQAHNATAKTAFFPLRLQCLNGTLDITDKGVMVRDMTAVIPPAEFAGVPADFIPPQVRVNASYMFNGAGSQYSVEARGVPVCQTAVEAIPVAGAKIWEELQPEGRCDVSVTIFEPPGESTSRFGATIQLQDVTVNSPRMPVPIRRVNGRVTVDEHGVDLQGVRGVFEPASGVEGLRSVSLAQMAIDGHIALDGPDTALRVSLENVLTTEELVKAIPEVGDRVWQALQPNVVLDAVVLLGDVIGSTGAGPCISLNIRGGEVHPEGASLRLADLTGRVKVDGGRVFIEHLLAAPDTVDESGNVTPTAGDITVAGLVDLETQELDIRVKGRDLLLTEELLQSAGDVGPQIWESVRPTGYVSMDGRIYRKDAADRLHYLIDLDLRDAAVHLGMLPAPITSLSGQAMVTDRRIVSNEFSGIICGGRVTGSAVLSYGDDVPYPSFAATVQFNVVRLDELMAEISGKRTDLKGQLSGIVDLGGFTDDLSSLRARGRVTLAGGRLWKSPVIVRLLSVLHLAMPTSEETPMRGEGSFTIADAQVHVAEFELLGGGLNASGHGTVGFDGVLDLIVVAVGAPESGRGIPIISNMVSWAVSAVEKQLVRVEVTGSVGNPQLKSQVLSKITAPLTSLRDIVTAPLSLVIPKGGNGGD